MIVKADNAEAKLLDNALADVSSYVDEICLTITGRNQACEDVAKKYNAKVSHFKWVDDFSKARTFNFKQATGDWILWMDADDTFRELKLLSKLVSDAERMQVKGMFLPYEYQHDDDGNVIEWHWKMQLVKNDKTFEWKGAIHEDLLAKGSAKIAKENTIVRVHNSNEQRGRDSFERNLTILQKELTKQGDDPDPRTIYYTAQSFLALNDYDSALELFNEYLERSGWDEERYQAWQMIGEIYAKQKNNKKALEAYSNSTLEREDYPDAYLNKGHVYVSEKNYAKAIANFKIGLRQPTPEGNIIHRPTSYKLNPLKSLAWCYLQIGQLDEAKETIAHAYKINPKDEGVIDIGTLIKNVKTKRDTGKAFLNIAKYLQESGEQVKIPPLLQGVPGDLLDSPFIVGLMNEYMPSRNWDENEIAIYCPRSVEFWAPPSLDEGGIGGSETAIVWLGRELTKLGWKVTVYNYCGTMAGDHDGVEYKNFWEFNANDDFNVLLSWRYPEFFDMPLNAKLKCLDLHDVMSPSDFPKERLENIDMIFVKTDYHRTLYPNVPDDKFVNISNGIDLKRFSKKVKKQKGRCIYSSTPNRGLDIVLKHWHRIKEEVPQAELHVYYGWNTFYELEKNNPERVKWMKSIQDQMNQPGIVGHGRVGQGELSDDMMKTDVWLYPTYFEEINCITALENQAAGVIPIATNFAALKETVTDSIPKIYGDIYEPDVQEEWVDLTIKTLQNEDRDNIRPTLEKFASGFSWEKIAEQWDKELRLKL